MEGLLNNLFYSRSRVCSIKGGVCLPSGTVWVVGGMVVNGYCGTKDCACWVNEMVTLEPMEQISPEQIAP